MFNKYVWNLYLDGGGRKVVETFENTILNGISKEYSSFIYNLQEYYCACSGVLVNTQKQLDEAYDYIKNNPVNKIITIPEDISDSEIEDVFSEVYESEFRNRTENDKDVFSIFAESIGGLSTSLAIDYPGCFIPYYFLGTYNVLTMIAEAFCIVLPEIPKKADYKGRVWHYMHLCTTLIRFGKEYDLSLFELCAFLYDFGPKYIGGRDSYILKELPEPKSAFFVGGGGDNEDANAEDNPGEIAYWQCNPNTRAGDMIVMYLRTPISAISSIWRSYSVGFNDPFFYYYRCTYIGLPKKLKRISLNKIRKDPVLAKMPIVNKNMQGINGVELKPSEYNHIVEITGADVPLLEFVMENDDDIYVNEKAVEEKLIKPLLSKLDYTESDYVQQLSIPVGNHNTTLIPDFVLLPKCSGGHYSAFAIIEAKRSITGEKQLGDVIIQARSYARILGVIHAAIASQEGIWVYSSKDDYSEAVFECKWSELTDEDLFYQLRKLLGNK